MSTPVILILGAGPNIGFSVANAFAAKGYKVAIAARSLQEGISDEGYLRIQVDLSNPETVEKVFSQVKEKFGIPSVVVYNAAARTLLDYDDPLSSILLLSLTQDFSINTLSPLMAAREAVKGFNQLPTSTSKTFIFTGNLLNKLVKPDVIPFGMAKTSLAYMIWAASVAYKSKGYKFYYADLRQPNGAPTIPVDGPATAEAYLELAEKPEQGPWNYTFLAGKGYVESFDGWDEAAAKFSQFRG